MKGTELTCSASFGDRRATSVSDRKRMGGAPCRMIQSSGNRTGPVGGAGAGGGGAGMEAGVARASAVARSGEPGVGDAGDSGLLDGDGRVT